MSITDELRERIDAVCRVSGWDCKRLTAIADRIDAALAERYVALPKDADGEYIHVGDMLVDWLSQGFAPKKVKMLMLEGNEWRLNFGSGWCAMNNHEWHHHALDTWERIIEDAMMGADRDGAPDTYQGCMDELVARCKVLAGDGE